MNLYSALENLTPYKVNFIKYPKTRKYGFDHSLIIYEILGADAIGRGKYLMIEVVKQLLQRDNTCAYLPKPFERLEYYPIPATMELISDNKLIIPYLLKIQERSAWADKEKYYNDLELSEKFTNFEKN